MHVEPAAVNARRPDRKQRRGAEHDDRIRGPALVGDDALVLEAGDTLVLSGLPEEIVRALAVYRARTVALQRRLEASLAWGVEVIWDLFHYGMPDGLEPGQRSEQIFPIPHSPPVLERALPVRDLGGRRRGAQPPGSQSDDREPRERGGRQEHGRG